MIFLLRGKRDGNGGKRKYAEGRIGWMEGKERTAQVGFSERDGMWDALGKRREMGERGKGGRLSGR